ncbi:phage tail protein [Sphingobium mellinum]|uniref:phage tail protein n=1 Tax=Sphingobium mellinum TaxID=1387166 RepID=UPI0030ED3EF9
MATLVLTALGTAIGGPIGAAIGGLIGNAFDQNILFRPRGREGRRLADLQLQTSTYGTQIPKLFGTMRVAGTVIWATDLKEQRHKSGGGKGRPSVTSYSYSASFAVALSARAVRSVGRIWADGNLLRGAAGDFKTEVGAFRLHAGGEEQGVDPLMASAEGLDRTPAHRGIAYVLFEDLQLADFGNRIPSLTFEVEADEGPVSTGAIGSDLSGGMLGGDALAALGGFAAGGASMADAIAPLAEAWDLGFVSAEDGLWLKGTSGAIAADIGTTSLCRRSNGRALDAVEQAASSAESVPVTLALRHYDAARDYQAGVQRVSRPGPGRTEEGIDLPAQLPADDARAVAARRLGHGWAGRSTITLRCGWDALRHEAGDVVSIEGSPGRWRIEEREWEAMAVRLALRRVPGGEAPLPAGASSGAIVRQGDAPHGPTTLLLIDLPSLTEGATAPLIVAAASGGAGWRGAALFAMSEAGEAMPIGRTAPRAVMGQADAALAPGSATLVDEISQLDVTLLADDMALGDADEAAIAAGRNLCLLGAELIQFSRAVQTGARSFRLTGLRRGLCGTEWAMASHAVGEPFLLVEQERLMEPFAMQPAPEIGSLVRVAAVGVGDMEPVQSGVLVSGEAVTPWAPVHLDAAPDGTGGLALRWTRRSRNGGRWLSGGDVPLAEESECYELRLLAGDALVRRVETDQPGWTYDAAMIAADGGAADRVEVRQVGTFAVGRPARLALPA